MNVFLTGFMASGKSSLGKKLAQLIDFDFIDLDHEIEQNEKMSINEIFSKKGEAHFRLLEKKTLECICAQKDNSQVISLGGGAACSSEILSFLKSKGCLVYLELPLKNIIGRLKKDNANRPLVKDLTDNELKEKVKNLFEKRQKYYLKADLIVDAQKPKNQLRKEIKQFIENQK